jgi:geranylgeranyl diphosphate synthase, type II
MLRPPDRGPLGTLPAPSAAGSHSDGSRQRDRVADAEADRWFAEYRDALEDAMRRGLGDRAGAPSGPLAARLQASLADATEGGKRFRPALLGVAYRAWGGTDPAASGAVGAAMELLHTGFVVHDDVIDADDTRRGRPSVLGAHTGAAEARGVAADLARAYGVAAGILAGDLLLTAAIRTVASAPVQPATASRLLDLFDGVLRISAAGELADVWLGVARDGATTDDALVVAERKTAEYSFALPLQAAAVLAGRSAVTMAAAGEVGRCLGTAYQLLDDLQGVFGELGVTGKSRVSDLRSGKQTVLVAHARTTDAWPEISRYVGLATITEEQAEVARGLLTASGSREHVQRVAGGYVDRAAELAHGSCMPPDLVAWLADLGAELLGGVA